MFRKTQNSCGRLYDAFPWFEPQEVVEADNSVSFKRINCSDIASQQLDSSVITTHSLLESGNIIEPNGSVDGIVPPSVEDAVSIISNSIPDEH